MVHFDPWDKGPKIDGAELLANVETFLARFVAFPSEHARVAATLWTLHSHLVDAAVSTPRLAILSPEPGSGKTRLLELLELLVRHPLPAISASPSAIFRTIAKERPTLLFDEVDAVFKGSAKDESAEALRGLINAGHRKGRMVPRCVGPHHEVRLFDTYAALALAGLGDLPDTVMDRSVIIRMRRRAPGEFVQSYREREHSPEGHELRQRLAEFAERVADDVRDAWPQMPDGVTDRPADVWEPLLAIAEVAGGSWPTRARMACLELCKVAVSREASLGVRLLADVRAVMGDAEAISTGALLEALHALEEAPWAELRGRPLDARGLARLLKQYGVSSAKVRAAEGKPLQGYEREQLWDAWQRYLPESPEHPEQAEPERGNTLGQADLFRNSSGTDHTANGQSERAVPLVPDVPVPSGIGAQSRDGCRIDGRWEACVHDNCLVFRVCVLADAEGGR